MKIIDRVKVVIERMKREPKELKMGFADYEGVWWKNGGFFLPTFILGIQKIDIAIGGNPAFLFDPS